MTAVAHCRNPSRCSVCLGAAARTVTVADGVVSVDGVEERPAQPAQYGAHNNAARSEQVRRAKRGKR